MSILGQGRDHIVLRAFWTLFLAALCSPSLHPWHQGDIYFQVTRNSGWPKQESYFFIQMMLTSSQLVYFSQDKHLTLGFPLSL